MTTALMPAALATEGPAGAANLRDRVARLAFVGCGAVLVAAAILKVGGESVSPFARHGWSRSPAADVAVVVWELLLGVWLVRGAFGATAARRAGGRPGVTPIPWVAAVLTFGGFAAVSATLGLRGRASCGCFGPIEASPWVAFGIDVAALALLAVGRPAWPAWRRDVGTVKWAGGTALALGAAAGIGVAAYGSFDGAVARLRGESLGATRTVIDLGSGRPGDVRSATVTVRNYTSRPARLIGGTSECSCIVTQNLPAEVAGGAEIEIPVSIRIPAGTTPGQLARGVVLFTDRSDQPKIDLRVVCRVEE